MAENAKRCSPLSLCRRVAFQLQRFRYYVSIHLLCTRDRSTEVIRETRVSTEPIAEDEWMSYNTVVLVIERKREKLVVTDECYESANELDRIVWCPPEFLKLTANRECLEEYTKRNAIEFLLYGAVVW